MGKGFSKNKTAELRAGRLVELKLNMLPGAPTVHLEHLGETNSDYWNEVLARQRQIDDEPKLTDAERRKRNRARNNETLLKHSIRKLDATHDDGTPATMQDAREWLESLPLDIQDMLFLVARDKDQFRDYNFANQAELAEK